MSQIQTIHLLMSQAQDNEPSYITGPDISSTYFKSQADQSATSQPGVELGLENPSGN